MAGQASKKLAQQAQTAAFYYSAIIYIISALHLGWRLWYGWSRMDAVGIAVLSFVNYYTYGAVIEAAEMGVGCAYYQDVLIINLAIEVLSLWKRAFWYLYLVVPGYAIYKIGRLVVDWALTPSMVDPESAAYKKKQEKMERKMRQGKVQVVRR